MNGGSLMVEALKAYFADVLSYMNESVNQALLSESSITENSAENVTGNGAKNGAEHENNAQSKPNSAQPELKVAKMEELACLKDFLAAVESYLFSKGVTEFIKVHTYVHDEQVKKLYAYFVEVCQYVAGQLETEDDTVEGQLFLARIIDISETLSRSPQTSQNPASTHPLPSDKSSALKTATLIIANGVFYLLLIVAVLSFALVGRGSAAREPARIAGHSFMTVLTISMEPTLPRNALVVLRHRDADLLNERDIVTYLEATGVTITHRIIDIYEDYEGSGSRAFRLQGDNNVGPDRDLIMADAVLGDIVFSSLIIGQIIVFIQHSPMASALLLIIYTLFVATLKSYFKYKKDTPHPQEQKDFLDYLLEKIKKTPKNLLRNPAKKSSVKSKRSLQTSIISLVLIGVMAFSLFQLLQITLNYRQINQFSNDVREAYVRILPANPASDAPAGHNRDLRLIDWEGLMARNSDVVGWIHMPETVIDYPILAGATNDTYLRTTLDGEFSNAGSIFLEQNNNSDFLDGNTIIYGHNMLNGVKFSDIDDMVRGTLTDANYIYVYLPNGMVNIYQVVSVQLTDILSEIYHLPVLDMPHFYDLMLEGNLWQNVPMDLLENIYETRFFPRVITLSTCSDAGISPVRSVVFGVLILEIDMNLE